jgi:hypothetical protein
LIVRLLDVEAQLAVTARDQPGCEVDLHVGASTSASESPLRIRLGEPALAERPSERPSGSACWCQLWEVPSPGGSSPALGEDALQELRALGYVR